MKKVLLIGKLPPPRGGVTVYTERLLHLLNQQSDLEVEFYDLKFFGLHSFLRVLLSHTLIHLNTSNCYLQLATSLLCFFFRKRLLITYHTDINRYTGIKRQCLLTSISICSVPIVLNTSSYAIAHGYNHSTKISTTALTNLPLQPIARVLREILDTFSERFSYLVCTNASTLSFDTGTKEIYGITDLLKWIENQPECGLILSDGSGQYKLFLEQQDILPHPQLCIISGLHDFRHVLPYAQTYIRNTLTDGDSLSIHEALDYGLHVWATEHTSRPEGCFTYKNLTEIQLATERRTSSLVHLSANKQLLKLYHEE